MADSKEKLPFTQKFSLNRTRLASIIRCLGTCRIAAILDYLYPANLCLKSLRFTMSIFITEIITEIGMKIDRGCFTQTMITTEIDKACFMMTILLMISVVDFLE